MKTFKRILPFIIGIVIPLAVGGISAAITMSSMQAYAGISKPPLSPPACIFPIAWTILYTMMGIASALVWKSTDKHRTDALVYYGFQLVLNFFWPLIFFLAKEYWFGFIWLIGLLIAVILTAVYFKKVSKSAFWLLVPYILWLIFAAYLNAGVAILN